MREKLLLKNYLFIYTVTDPLDYYISNTLLNPLRTHALTRGDNLLVPPRAPYNRPYLFVIRVSATALLSW